MKRSLSRAFDPPAAVVPVRVCAPGGLDVAGVDGKLDTGADLCAIPERLVAELALPAVRTVRAAGFAGTLQEVVVYRIDLEIDTLRFERVEALTTRRPYLIVGRNVLRHVVLRIDGPREQVELRRSSPRKRR